MRIIVLIIIGIGGAAMALIPFLSNSKAWTEGRLPEPWDKSRPSIYEFIASNTDEETGRLRDRDLKLPDEPKKDENTISWVSGGFEGAFGHHSGQSDENNDADKAFRALKSALKNPNAQNISKFYKLIKSDYALDYIDPFLEKILNDSILHDERVPRLATWIAENAPDRGPVKVSIAILGVSTTGEADDIVLTLGRHEEFTLYSAVALSNSSNVPEQKIWELARSVTGWGRIQAVERLHETNNEDIKAWLIRDGFRNDIMYEYLAYICAVGGDLRAALDAGTPDEKLLTGARDIIDALIAGGPAEDMSDYADGPEVTKSYLELVGNRELALADFITAHSIRDYVASTDSDWSKNKGDWNSKTRSVIEGLANQVIAQDSWTSKVEQGLHSDDSVTFYEANRAAKLLSIDTWDIHFEKVQRDPKGQGWWELMQTDDIERIRKVVDYAEKSLPLNEVATGPGDSLGLGKKYWAHSALDFIVQDLKRFPGEGWLLVKTSLQSPVVRNRNMAIKALDAWPRDEWPDDAVALLKDAEKAETEEDVKNRISALISGDELPD